MDEAYSLGMPFLENIFKSEVPQTVTLEKNNFLDVRGVSFSEYQIRENTEMIPLIQRTGLAEVILYLEKEGIPKDLEMALKKLDSMISMHLKYDAMNYLLGMQLDGREESFISRIDPAKIDMSSEQFSILRDFLKRSAAADPEI